MSQLNRIIPVVLAVGVGIFNGIYVFDPAFQDQKEQREKTFDKQHAGVEPTAPHDSQEAAALNASKPSNGESVAKAATQQVEGSKAASGSGSWSKSWVFGWPGSRASNEAKQPQPNDNPTPPEQAPTANKS